MEDSEEMIHSRHLINSIYRSQNGQIRIIGESNNHFKVLGDHGKIYNVNFKDNMIINCTCPHCFYRKTVCKHMMYVSLNKDIDIKNFSLKEVKYKWLS